MSVYLPVYRKDKTIPPANEMRSLMRRPSQTYTVRRLSDGADLAHLPRDADGLDHCEIVETTTNNASAMATRSRRGRA